MPKRSDAKSKVIAIVGLGLMGGSLAAACRRKFPQTRVLGISRNRSSLKLAQRKKWIREGTTNLADGVSRAKLVVLCTPVDTFPAMLSKIDRAAKPGTLVTDVGSVKGHVESWLRKKRFKNIRFVSAHPMVGSHKRGFAASALHLYDRGFVFLIRSSRTDPRAFAAVRKFWKRIASQVIALSPQKHDRIVSEISHLPHLAAAALVLSAAPSSRRFASSGFADTTRVAQGHPSIWLPIFRANRTEVMKTLDCFEKVLKKMKKDLGRKNFSSLGRRLRQAARTRSQISL